MKKFVTFIIIVMMLCCLFSFTGCQAQDKNDTLIVAMELAYPPFETKDADGNPAGVSVDFSKALAEHLGMEIEIVDTAWDGLIPTLQTGKADMVMSSMTITEDRKEEVDFSEPYANAFLAILANKNSAISSIDDLNEPDKKVAVKTGSTGYLYAQDNLKNAEVIALADESACVAEVNSGKADGFLYDQLTIYRNNQENPETTRAIFIPFQDVEYWGIAVKKGNTELLESINLFIDEYRDGGGFEELTLKHLKDEQQAFDELGFKWFFDLS